MDLSSLDLDAVTVHQPRMPATDIAIALDWAQETDQVKFFLPLVGVLHGLRARDLDLKIRASRIEITRRGTNGKVLAAGTLGGKVDPSECEWEVAKEELVVSLRKTAQREWAHALQLDALVEELQPGPTGGLAGASSSGAPPSTVPSPPPPPPGAGTAKVAAAAPVPPSPPVPHHSPRAATAGSSGKANGGLGAKGGLGEKYKEWDQFDDLGAMMDVENEGLNPEEPTMTLRSSPGESGKPGVAGLQCTTYVKDKEEIALDEELGAKREALQRSFNETAQHAADLKAKGNELLKQGKAAEALETYLEGEHSLEVITGHATILLSARLAELTRTLLRDLQNNAAQAALGLEEWDEAVRCATAVLEYESAQPKALYRRSLARIGRAAEGDQALARADLKALLRVDPRNGAARKLLDGLGYVV